MLQFRLERLKPKKQGRAPDNGALLKARSHVRLVIINMTDIERREEMSGFDDEVEILRVQQDMLEMKRSGMVSEKNGTEEAAKAIACGHTSERKQRTHMLIQLGSAILKETGRKSLSDEEIASLAEAVRQIYAGATTSQADFDRYAMFGRMAEDIYRKTTGHGFSGEQLGKFRSFLEYQERGGYFSKALASHNRTAGNGSSGSH